MTRQLTTRRLASVLWALVAVAAAAVALSPPAHAALGLRDTADARPWMTNGAVYAQALSGDGETLYIGGRFNSVREKPPGTAGRTLAVSNVAAIDVATGAPVSGWRPNVAGTDGTAAPVVRALAVKNGRVYIGGQFSAVGGQPRRNLAAVDAATGAVAGSFAPTVGEPASFVHALAATDARLYLGGKFASVDGTSRGNLAAVNPVSGALDTAWRARADELVRDLEFSRNGDGTIFAVGRFDSVSSAGTAAERQSVARFDAATGAVHPWAVPSGTIENPMTCWDATVTPARLFVGCGLGPNFSAAFRLDNGNSGDRVWRTGFSGNPQALALSPDGSRLIVGGHFGINRIKQQACGEPLGGLLALYPGDGRVDCSSGWVPHLDQNRDPSYDGAWDILSTDRQVWVGGGFVGVSGEPRTNLARFTYGPDLAADSVGPAITRPRPAPGAEIRDRTPTVRATVRDGASELAKADVRLYIDGSRRTFSYDPATDLLSRTTWRLPYGRHRVRVEATDAAGNASERAWSFWVVRGH